MPEPDSSTAASMPAYEKARLQTVAFKHVRETVSATLKSFALNTTQWMVLGILNEAESSQKISTIAQNLQVEVPLITTLTQPLVASGFIEQHADARDRRSKPLSLTEAGIGLLQKIESRLASELQLLEAGIAEDSLEQYFHTLRQLIANGEEREREKHKRN